MCWRFNWCISCRYDCRHQNYRSKKLNILAYIVYSFGPMGTYIAYFVDPEGWASTMLQNGTTQEYINAMNNAAAWWVLVIMIVGTALIAWLSGLVGCKLLRKQFEKGWYYSMTGETRKRKWGICFDPRTKVLLLIISMIIATTAPSLSYECALILLIAVMGVLCGKVRYSIIGTIVFLVLYLFTTLYLGNVTGTALYHVHSMAVLGFQGVSLWNVGRNCRIHDQSK